MPKPSSLKRSHCWWHREGDIGALWEAAEAAGWRSEDDPGRWAKVVRAFRDGHREEWWALEVEAGPYGPERVRRAVVVTTDPERLPTLATWYLATSLPAPGSEREKVSDHCDGPGRGGVPVRGDSAMIRPSMNR